MVVLGKLSNYPKFRSNGYQLGDNFLKFFMPIHHRRAFNKVASSPKVLVVALSDLKFAKSFLSV